MNSGGFVVMKLSLIKSSGFFVTVAAQWHIHIFYEAQVKLSTNY